MNAACAGMTETFDLSDVIEDSKALATKVAEAKAICATCPALAECRTMALGLSDPIEEMVVGGMSHTEYAKLWLAARKPHQAPRRTAPTADWSWNVARIAEDRTRVNAVLPDATWLREALTRPGMTVTALARDLGCDRRSIHRRIEHG